MTNSSDEPDTADRSDGTTGIDDSDLPDDLNPEKNPLAGGLDNAETAGDLAPGELLEEGKTADQSDTEDPDDAEPEDAE